ncbi:hypothetical protein GCM10011534_30670 [Pseudooceanicola nanhaiensis]|jgi:DGQHR domain-containing protein|uniref:DGQHR domain-containing protein n=1 Tax=Pseudooceanicola nanhaiensis TaxID=375761 RepID=A0A917T0N8_9RHOB|nr:DGQHR domain-containing protein [Pseudooceanicola nanhaiensis]GGM06619.1 hypothetical protein GCM10011534_30670 [Pseudooceanicola nanhaiensis]
MTEQLSLVDPDPIHITLDCLRAVQPIGDLFFASIPHDVLRKITYFDVRRVLQEERDVERYLGIQRPLSKNRVEKLYDYVNFFDATFPTAVILAVDESYADYDINNKTLTISNVARNEDNPSILISNIARVLDGQHRIAGLETFRGAAFDVPVTIFVGADIADQAQIFATVNLEQQKVNKSLAYDLYSLSSHRSPQKTAHNVAVVLDRDKKSPFFERIKRLGVATLGRDFEPLSQATFVEAVMRYITDDPRIDRDTILRGKSPRKALGEEKIRLPFRNLFLEDRDIEIVQAIFDYFAAIRDRWPVAWATEDRGNMLNRTNGFRAFMRAYEYVNELQGDPDKPVSSEFASRFMAKVPLEDEDFNTEKFPPGSTGESTLNRLLRGVAVKG